MKRNDLICFICDHFVENNLDENLLCGCRAYPDGIPYLYPPHNKHAGILKGQTGKFIYVPAKSENIRYLSLPDE